MNRGLLVLFSIELLGVACGKNGPGSYLSANFQRAVIDEPDGRVSLYSGMFIADRLVQGYDLESLDYKDSFLRVRVPRAMLDDAVASPAQRSIISLEESHPDVEI